MSGETCNSPLCPERGKRRLRWRRSTSGGRFAVCSACNSLTVEGRRGVWLSTSAGLIPVESKAPV
jgi:hypothetical protein